MADQLTDHARTTTFRVARAMYPHDAFPDEIYEKLVDKLEADASSSDEIRAAIEEGVAELDVPLPFEDLDAQGQLDALRAAQDSAYFQLVRAAAVVEIYDNPQVWQLLGYEGPSVHLGGYVNRGFNDLDWLPDPPIELDPTAGSHHS